MDKNKMLVALIVFIVVFGGIAAFRVFSPKPVLEVIPVDSVSETESLEEESPATTPVVTENTHPLLGTKWVWLRTEYTNGTKTDAPQGKFVLTINKDMTLSSTTDCNGLSSKFIVDDEILSIGPIASTKMACSGETLETTYSQQLGRAASHVIKGDELRIILWKDAGIMVFDEVL